MKPTQLRRLPASSFARRILANYGANFISVMPTNLYGPNDNFDLETSTFWPRCYVKRMRPRRGKIES
jgi:GDP-L-fucose synthase